MSPNTHWSTSRFRSTGADFWSLLHIPSDEKQHRSLISVIFQKQTYDLIQLSDDFCVFLCFLILQPTLIQWRPVRASAGCDLIIHVVALLVQFLGKETFAKTRVIANKVSASHLSPNKRGKLPHTVCKNTIWLQVYFFIIFYCLKYEQSFQIWKMKPMQKCFKPAVFLAASRGQLHRFHL